MRATKSKLDQLDDFLLNLPDEQDEAMLIEELYGFLAGVIVCPDIRVSFLSNASFRFLSLNTNPAICPFPVGRA